MTFEKDVFISYAHLDDKPLDETAKGWITEFHKLLKTRLEQTIGHDISVWRDEKLTGNEIFAPEIEAQLPKLKVMVSIVTPRYVQSDWCKHELNYFYKAANQTGGLAVGNKSRIFKVVKTPVDKDAIQELPGDIQRIFDEILDYKFYRWESDTGRFKELGPYSWTDNKIRQEYMDKLDDVAQDIAHLIKNLKNTDSPQVVRKKIFLAETTYDLQGYRDNLVRELKEAGFSVLPERNLPHVINKFNEEVEQLIDESVLTIHLVSPANYAVQPEGSDKSVVFLQNEIAARKSGQKNLPRLIWIPPSTTFAISNEKLLAVQKAFVEELKRDADMQRGADILEGPLEEFKQAIFDTIKRMEREEKLKREAEEKAKKLQEELAHSAVIVNGNGNGESRLVYLVCDQRDLDDTRPLEDFVTDSGHEILLPLFDGDQAQLRQAHVENLKICDAVIIYYGAANYRWASSMKSDLLRLPALGRAKPLIEKAIYLAGPADKDKETFKANDFRIFNCFAGFSEGLFCDFIQKLK
jgi:hypothetical protein